MLHVDRFASLLAKRLADHIQSEERRFGAGAHGGDAQGAAGQIISKGCQTVALQRGALIGKKGGGVMI